MIALAVFVFLVEAFIVYRLGYTHGVFDGALEIGKGLRKVLTPEEMKELDEKVQRGLLKYNESKSK